MAGSKYAYVKSFELPDTLLPGTFIVLRLDGHAFHRFADAHSFARPNDERALCLMDCAARAVMDAHPDVVLAFGESDEYSFLLRRRTTLYARRGAKIVSTVTSLFTAAYVLHWGACFGSAPLRYAPSFDGRVVLYPSVKEVRDYFAWRQVDTHINNLYNTAFWALVQQGGHTAAEAHAALRGTVASEKHELLFSRFGVNYNALDARYRKGSVLVREEVPLGPDASAVADDTPAPPTHEPPEAEAEAEVEAPAHSTDAPSSPDANAHTSGADAGEQDGRAEGKDKGRGRGKEGKRRMKIELYHCDVIGDEFWEARPWLLAD